MTLQFNRDFDPEYGRLVTVVPGLRRLTAENPGPYTFRGTNSYIVGEGKVALIDPGPEVAAHIDALAALHAREPITHIIITHSHRDHTEALGAVRELTGAPVHAAAPPAAAPETDRPPFDAGADLSFSPDLALADGDRITGSGWTLDALATPGHASDHVCLALGGSDILLSGDHVMGWSTTVVAPPDGDMAAYMASLDRLLGRRDARYLPGHGGSIDDPQDYVADLKAHRVAREAAILEQLELGHRTIAAIVAAVYRDTDPKLHRAAGLSVRAHLEHLIGRGLVASTDEAGEARYSLG